MVQGPLFINWCFYLQGYIPNKGFNYRCLNYPWSPESAGSSEVGSALMSLFFTIIGASAGDLRSLGKPTCSACKLLLPDKSTILFQEIKLCKYPHANIPTLYSALFQNHTLGTQPGSTIFASLNSLCCHHVCIQASFAGFVHGIWKGSLALAFIVTARWWICWNQTVLLSKFINFAHWPALSPGVIRCKFVNTTKSH